MNTSKYTMRPLTRGEVVQLAIVGYHRCSDCKLIGHRHYMWCSRIHPELRHSRPARRRRDEPETLKGSAAS